MPYNVDHTIAAIASAPGGAARGVVRISGPDAIARLSRCFTPRDDSTSLPSPTSPRRVAGWLCVDGDGDQSPLNIPGDLLIWPSARSYTREPSAEFHTIGSPPLLAAVVEQLGRAGIRPAERGEFTLRAFLAGRIDLTQAEAVLGVIDAQGRSDLDAALDQLAGGLSRPLHRLREQLLDVLAELEAGLDFVEEDIEFISRGELRRRLAAAQAVLAATLDQLSARDVRTEAPRIAITGPPNAGKSSLFNALVERYGPGATAAAIVSPQPGATRDFVTARLNLNGVICELIDTAGIDSSHGDVMHHAAQQTTAQQQRLADVQLRCLDATVMARNCLPNVRRTLGPSELVAATKVDLPAASLGELGEIDAHFIRCSSVTGVGLEELAGRLRIQLAETSEGRNTGAAAATSARCAGSLREADRALAAAVVLVSRGGDELIAAEIRAALDALGEVVGAVCTDDVLDRVFRQFCIGK